MVRTPRAAQVLTCLPRSKGQAKRTKTAVLCRQRQSRPLRGGGPLSLADAAPSVLATLECFGLSETSEPARDAQNDARHCVLQQPPPPSIVISQSPPPPRTPPPPTLSPPISPTAAPPPPMATDGSSGAAIANKRSLEDGPARSQALPEVGAPEDAVLRVAKDGRRKRVHVPFVSKKVPRVFQGLSNLLLARVTRAPLQVDYSKIKSKTCSRWRPGEVKVPPPLSATKDDDTTAPRAFRLARWPHTRSGMAKTIQRMDKAATETPRASCTAPTLPLESSRVRNR